MGMSTGAGTLHRIATKQVQTAVACDHADGGGLWLRVREAGASWVLRYTAPDGRRRDMGLGIAHRGSLAQAGASLTSARAGAHAARELLRVGVDPLESKAKGREVAAQALVTQKASQARERWTLARCARDYHERVVEPNRTSKHAAQWIASLENHIPPALWHIPIEDIEPAPLLRALLAVSPHERARNLKGGRLLETTSRIRQRLDAIFEDAMFHRRASSNPAAALRRKLTEAAPKRQTKGRLAALPYRDAPDLLRLVRAMPGTAARCLEFAVLTAARTGEVIDAEWAEVDIANGVWTVPADRMKSGETHVVYLPPRAVDLLWLQISQDVRLVFPSPMTLGKPEGERKPLSKMAMLAALDRLKVRDKTTVHGLCRSTFSTWANETGAARPDVIEACLAHEEVNRVRAAYNRSDFAKERAALLRAWAEYLARPALALVQAA